MLDDGLPALVEFRMGSNALPVLLKERGVEVALDELAVFGRGAARSRRARLAGPGAILMKAGLLLFLYSRC